MFFYHNPVCTFKKNIRTNLMTTAIKLSEDIVKNAKIRAKVLNRSLAGQIEHWARMGRLAEENPDLTYSMLKDILIAQQEAAQEHLEPYHFGKNK
jgi:hypothetical protein